MAEHGNYDLETIKLVMFVTVTNIKVKTSISTVLTKCLKNICTFVLKPTTFDSLIVFFATIFNVSHLTI